jgi:acetoin utilization deacetylase AcuC-like enzyme
MSTSLPVIHHPAYEVDIGPHVFPTLKYRLVRDELLRDGTLRDSDILRPEPATDDQVSLVHDQAFVQKINRGSLTRTEEMVLEVPYSPELRDAMWLCAGGSIATARKALETGIAVHLGGGFHHAFPDHGEGFCLINDVAIAIRTLQAGGEIERAVVIDCDVHHGNGTAAIFRDDPSVFTFSMHQERNYPAWKPPGDLDLGLDDRTGDAEYLGLLERHIPNILDRQRFQLAFYLAGADPYQQDQLGGLSLTIEGLAARDGFVFDSLREHSIPVAVTLAGGYAVHQGDTIAIHCNTVRHAAMALRS